jgi:predicted amidohydrolase
MENRTGQHIEGSARIELGQWRTGSPNHAITPDFVREIQNGETIYRIISKSHVQNYGKWLCDVSGILAGHTYSFSAEYLAEDIIDENEAISLIVTWQDADGGWLVRDYADSLVPLEDGWKRVHRTIDAPEKAERLTMELVMKWTPAGRVSWRKPAVMEAEPVVHRIVRAATTFIKPRGDLKKNLDAMLLTLDKAGKCKPDIICLTENFYNRGTDLPLEEVAEPVPGRLTELLGGKAREYECHVLFSMIEREGDIFYNTAVLLGREGQIIGKYRKMHLALFEGENGVTPGGEYPVFTTDFGKIGILICWDSWFPEPARILRLKGAEMLFVPTAGDGPIQTVARAVDNGVHVISAGTNGGARTSRIIDPTGKIIGTVKSQKAGVAIADIDLDKRFYQYWHSVGPAFGEPKSIYLKERRAGTYGLLRQGSDFRE